MGQVGYLQELYRDSRSAEHQMYYTLVRILIRGRDCFGTAASYNSVLILKKVITRFFKFAY